MGNTAQTNQPGQAIQVNISHPKFTNTKLIKTQNEVFIQSVIMCEEKESARLQKQLKVLQPSKTSHLFLPRNIKFQPTRLCGTSGHLQLLYPYYPYLLSEEVYNRNGKRVRFEETDLWYLLYCIAAGKEELVQCGLEGLLESVDMGSVFLNDEGRIKVACRWSWPGAMSVWQRALEKESVYISQQCFRRIAKGQMQPQGQQSSKLSQLQSQYSVGLTLLNCALLVNQSTSIPLMDYKQMSYNTNELTRRINEFILLRGYSDILKSIVINLVCSQPNQRLSHKQLWELIRNHGGEIEDRKNFVIDNPTVKVHMAVQRFRAMLKALSNSKQVTYYQQQTNPLYGQIIHQPKHITNLVDNLNTSTIIKHEIVSSPIKSQLNQQPQPATSQLKQAEPINIVEQNTRSQQ